MSGIEVAGLILATFPLLISALEHYREGEQALFDWWKYKRAYKKCKQEINFYQLAFEGTLEELLLPLVGDDAKLQMLLQDPGGPAWNNSDMDHMLRKRIPKAYGLYVDVISDIRRIVEKLESELGITKATTQDVSGFLHYTLHCHPKVTVEIFCAARYTSTWFPNSNMDSLQRTKPFRIVPTSACKL